MYLTFEAFCILENKIAAYEFSVRIIKKIQRSYAGWSLDRQYQF